MAREYSTAEFTWDKEAGCLCTEASTIGWGPADKVPHIIRVRSEHTNEVQSFMYAGMDRNTDDDVVGFYYLPMTIGSKVVKITIFND